jgi:transcriptional regulator with XRE-family HTH domain
MPAEERLHRAQEQDVDRRLAVRVRERRIMLGMSQQRLAELIGVTYQQVHKYEKGLNRVPASRLYSIAQALGVEVGYFYEGLQTAVVLMPPAQQRMLIDLAHDYLNISIPEHRAAIVALARALAEPENGDEPAPGALIVGRLGGMRPARRRKGIKRSRRLGPLAAYHGRLGVAVPPVLNRGVEGEARRGRVVRAHVSHKINRDRQTEEE